MKASVYLYARILPEITARGDNRSAVINRDLERLYSLYKRALKEVRFTSGEAHLIVDALNGTLMDSVSAQSLWAEVEDAIRLDGLDEKWEVDGPVLVEKLRGLSSIQAMAVIDAAERFWEADDAERSVAKYYSIVEE